MFVVKEAVLSCVFKLSTDDVELVVQRLLPTPSQRTAQLDQACVE